MSVKHFSFQRGCFRSKKAKQREKQQKCYTYKIVVLIYKTLQRRALLYDVLTYLELNLNA